MLQVGWWGVARETSITVSPYGVSLCVVQCFQAKLLSVLQVGWGVAWCLLMERCCSVVRGLQAKFDGVFYRMDRCCTNVQLGRWRGCTSWCCIW